MVLMVKSPGSTSGTSSQRSGAEARASRTRRIGADERVARAVHVVRAGVPGVQLDAAEVRDPGEARGVGHDREVRLVPWGVADVHGLEPVRVRVRYPLLIEELAVHAVGVPL